MSETNEENSLTTSEEQLTNPEQSEEQLKVFVNRKTDEIRIQDASGKEMLLKAIVIGEDDDDDDDDDDEPLSVEDFGNALKKIDDLGLTWTADSPPFVVPKNPEAEVNFGSEEFISIQKEYPHLPREVSIAASYALTENKNFAGIVGGLEILTEKAEIIKKTLITPEFRSEFFFKHAIKIPYLHDIDWEVVLKLSENNVEGMPAVAYGLLSLTLREPHSTASASNHQHLTVAVNEKSLDTFIEIFKKVKDRLKMSMTITKGLTKILEDAKEDAKKEIIEESKKDDESTK